MAMAEDMTAFFNTAEFAVAASFTHGATTQTASVILNSPTEDVLGGRALSDEYGIMYSADDLSSIVAGDSGTVDGDSYTVREIRLLEDGKVKAATLTKN